MIPLTGAIDVCGVLTRCRGEFVAPLMSLICFVLSPSTSHHLSTQSNDEGGAAQVISPLHTFMGLIIQTS